MRQGLGALGMLNLIVQKRGKAGQWGLDGRMWNERRIIQACMLGRHALGATFPRKFPSGLPYEIRKNFKAI